MLARHDFNAELRDVYSDPVEKLISMTECSRRDAANALERCDADLAAAVDLIFREQAERLSAQEAARLAALEGEIIEPEPTDAELRDAALAGTIGERATG